MKLRIVCIASLLLTLYVVWLFALHPSWYNHLVVDIVGQYLGHAQLFQKTHSLATIGYNEYQPGAVTLFVLLSFALKFQNSYVYLLNALFVVNIICALGIGVLLLRATKNPLSITILSLILLFTGPIILFRFELFVMFFVILGIYFAQKEKYSRAMIALAGATIIKIFPIILIPYLLIIIFKNQGLKKAVQQLGIFLLTLAGLLLLYIALFQVPFTKIADAFLIHSQKPVHVESIWGSILTVLPYPGKGVYATGRGDVGIFGIAKEYWLLPLSFYNNIWMFAIAGVYLVIIVMHKKNQRVNAPISILLMLVFLITSKILTPQYLLWAFLLFPLTTPTTLNQKNSHWVFSLTLILLASILSQYVYPLNYSALVDTFYRNGTESRIFWVLFFRNSALIILTAVFFYQIFKKEKHV